MGDEKHVDCLILGAGISGINTAYYLQKHCKWASYKILERRANLGGTWDFIKYPGIRNDSDMYTYGFSWKIWKSSKPFANAGDILDYLNEGAQEQGIKEKIHFNTDVKTAKWMSSNNRWHLETVLGEKYSCDVLVGCTGYFSYENPFEPTFPGQKNFLGEMVHSHKWTEEHDKMIVGKKVCMIGSGATAVSILPSIANVVAHVTMVQEIPSYISSKPNVSSFNGWLPSSMAGRLNRWKNMAALSLYYRYCLWFPESAKKSLKADMFEKVESTMSYEEFEKHFTPPYNPWEERVNLSPGGDFFKPIRDKKATIVTGQIDHLTEHGIQMKNGEHVDADFIISATGMNVQHNFPFSTIQVSVDGEPYQASTHLLYQGIMLNDVPNFTFVVGCSYSSWTLKADLASLYSVKLMKYMKSNKIARVVPREDPKDDVKRSHFIGGFTTRHFVRGGDIMPKVGNKKPWKFGFNYIKDRTKLTLGILNKDSLEFTNVEETNAQYGNFDESDMIYNRENEAKVGDDMNSHMGKLNNIETDLTKDGVKEHAGSWDYAQGVDGRRKTTNI